MQIKFKPESFLWLKENSGDKSIPAFVSDLVDDMIRVSTKGAEDAANNRNTRGTEQ